MKRALYPPRREVLSLIGRVLVAPLLAWAGTRFEVEDVALRFGSGATATHVRHYQINQIVSALGVPLIAKHNVGGAVLQVEEHATPDGIITALQFFAGSWPGQLHGLNRFGMAQESVCSQSQRVVASAYFGFMTSSPETDFTAARKSLAASGESLTLSASHGRCSLTSYSTGVFVTKIEGGFTWLNCARVAEIVREGMPAENGVNSQRSGADAIPTFLYAARAAMLARVSRETEFLHAAKIYRLLTHPREKSGEHLAMEGRIRNEKGHVASQFHVTYDRDDSALPVSIEFRPRSFLALRFEQTTLAQSPVIPSLLQEEPA
ncbi:MAG TPA: hypothetical protein VKU01_17505 [Bryobacteraceae bacterium]|nr:hypothetical protein [Bryobacteraceae bacterium]